MMIHDPMDSCRAIQAFVNADGDVCSIKKALPKGKAFHGVKKNLLFEHSSHRDLRLFGNLSGINGYSADSIVR